MTPNSNAGSQLTVDGVKPSTPPARAGGETTPVPESAKPKDENTNESVIANGSKGPHDAPASPQVHTQQYQQGYAPQLTPQPGAGYYFLGNHQVTPEPPSPATPGYDVNSFLQHQAAALGVHHGNPFGSGQYGGIPQPPLSPSRVGMTGGLIPPASPLFPRAAGNPVGSFDQQNQLDSSVFQRIQGQTPASPSMPYMASPSLGPSNGATFGGVYQGYAANTGTYASVLSGAQGGEPSASPDDRGWGDRYVALCLTFACCCACFYLAQTLFFKETTFSRVSTLRLHPDKDKCLPHTHLQEPTTGPTLLMKACCRPLFLTNKTKRAHHTRHTLPIKEHLATHYLHNNHGDTACPATCTTRLSHLCSLVRVRTCSPTFQEGIQEWAHHPCTTWVHTLVSSPCRHTIPQRRRDHPSKQRPPTRDLMELTCSFSIFQTISRILICTGYFVSMETC